MKSLIFSFAVGALLLIAPTSFAATCTSNTDCIFTFDIHNGGFSGITTGAPYGTLELALSGNQIDVTIDLNSNFMLVGTGFPGSFGYNASVGGITAGTFSNANYSGSTDNGGNESNDLHFDGFGYFDDAAATTAPHPGGSGTNDLSFILSRTGGFSSIQQLIEAPSGGGDGSPYFVVDAFDKGCGSTTNTACTGLLGVSNLSTATPEPSSLLFLLGAGLVGAAVVSRRRKLSASPSIQ